VIQGACLILRREVLDQVGLLDEDYFMYSEEVDLCHRILKAGWDIYWVPQAQVVHYEGESTKQVPVEMFLNLYKSKILYFRKHKGWLQAQVYKLILFAAAIARLLLSPFALLRFAPQRQRYLTLANYYRRLLKVLPGL
jgi:GT2 family glycosyltransferase